MSGKGVLSNLGKPCDLLARRSRTPLKPHYLNANIKHSDEVVGHIKWYLQQGMFPGEIAMHCNVRPGYVHQVRDELVRAHIKPLKP